MPGRQIKWTAERFDQFLIYNNMNMIRTGEWQSYKGKIECQCTACNRQWSPWVGNVLRGHKCICWSGNAKLTNKDVDRIIIEKNLGIIRLEDIKNARHNHTWECTTCHNPIHSSWDNIVNHGRKGCGCRGGIFCLTEEYAEKTYHLSERKIKIIELRPRKEKSSFLCLECKKPWDAIKGNVCRHNNPSGCPNCINKRQSFVEDLLRKYFPQTPEADFLKIIVVDPEFRIPEVNDGKRVDIDFVITYNNKTKYIEYDGEQHFRPVTYGNRSIKDAEEDYQLQIIRDNNVKAYCKDKNIPLLNIPYTMTDKQIEERIIQLKEEMDKNV